MYDPTSVHPFAENHRDLIFEVSEFVEAEIRPTVDATQPSDLLVGLARKIAQRWAGISVDPRYGGNGVGNVAKLAIIDTIAHHDPGVGGIAQALFLGQGPFLWAGTEEQKRKWLPPICSGELIATIAVTEPAAGGDISNIEMTAERDGSDWILIGEKSFVGNSNIADLHCVIARTPDGLAVFVVESWRSGLTLSEYVPSDGLEHFSFGRLVFDRCRVPAENMLGGPGDGDAAGRATSMLIGRITIGALCLGIHRIIGDEAIAYSSGRILRGKPLAQRPKIRDDIARIQTNLGTAETLLYSAAHLLDQGLPADTALCMAKLVGYEAAEDSARRTKQLHGASGTLSSVRISKLRAAADAMFAPAGTSGAQLHLLSEMALNPDYVEWSQRFAERFPKVEAA